MNTKTLWICAVALIGLAVIGITGCGSNQAEDLPATETAAPSQLDEGEAVESAAAAEAKAALAEQRVEIAEREAELARRELAAAEAERELAERAIELEEPVAGLDEPLPVAIEAPAARTVSVNVPASTSISVEMADALSSESNLAGDGFRATVTRDIVSNGYVAIPAGSKVLGTVSDVVASKKIGGQASMELRFDRIDLPSGEIVPIAAFVQLTGDNQKKKDAATIGGSAAGGALVGRILGKKKGKSTAIGAVLGAAVGTAVASRNQGDPVVVEPGMLAELFLEQPVEVAVVVDPTDAVADNR
jgi:hypothetical protein